MDIIKTKNYSIELGNLTKSSFNSFLNKQYVEAKKIILVDENTNRFCLEYLITNFEQLSTAEILEIPSGEENKTLDISLNLWKVLQEYQISKKDLLINLGGGVITDLGGFVASIYKRGIDFIHIPTTLLAMIDASIGGKTGVDLDAHKNMLGVISFPKKIYIDTNFLHTLPVEEMNNGFAEMLKHALISSKNEWEKLKYLDIKTVNKEFILTSIQIKNEIVTIDPFEKNIRKKLNFGHTIGHAVESYFMEKNKKISHGFAVAMGIIYESYISYIKGFLTLYEFEEIKKIILMHFNKLKISKKDFDPIFQYMLNDKKNVNQMIMCVLLKKIGEAEIDIPINKADIFETLEYAIS